MEVSISARHGSLSEANHDYIEKKIPKLVHIFERLTSVKVTIDFQRPEPEVELLVSAEHKHDFVARERHASVTAAFDNVLSNMQNQLRKYKEKVTDHHRKNAGLAEEASAPAAGEEA